MDKEGVKQAIGNNKSPGQVAISHTLVELNLQLVYGLTDFIFGLFER